MNETTTDTNIESIVMRRVRTVHAVRPLFSSAMLALGILALSLWGIGREVWVARVFQNAPHADIAALARFFLAAFLNTRTIVQALIALTLVAAIYLAREIARLATPGSTARA